MSTTTLIAVRHGETEWNLAGRAQGHLDSPLTETGRAQAELLADGLVGKGVDVIVSSDLGRAIATCQAIATRLGMDFTTDSSLRERHLGLLQGLTQEEFQHKHPQAYANYKDPTQDVAIPTGESRMEHLQRSVAAVEAIIQHHLSKTILVVCHGGVLDCFLYHTLGMAPKAQRPFAILNASINSFEIKNGEWKLITWGDVSHLHAIRALDEI